MPVDDVLIDCEMHMEKATDHLQHELRGLRTGRASSRTGARSPKRGQRTPMLNDRSPMPSMSRSWTMAMNSVGLS